MRMGTTIMHDTFTTPPTHRTTPLGRIGKAPSRLMTVSEWWYEMEEAVELLSDPQATFTEDGHELVRLCLANRIPYRPASDGQAMAFPAWLLREFYPDNP